MDSNLPIVIAQQFEGLHLKCAKRLKWESTQESLRAVYFKMHLAICYGSSCLKAFLLSCWHKNK